MVMVWLHIKYDLRSGKYYSENIWIMEDIVDKSTVLSYIYCLCGHGSLGENP